MMSKPEWCARCSIWIGKLTRDLCTKQSTKFEPRILQALKSVADSWLICALAERDAAQLPKL